MKGKQFENLTMATFGDPIVLIGQVVGGFQHGFNSNTGAWCLSDLGGGADGFEYSPAYFILFTEKGKRKPMVINEKYIIHVRTLKKKIRLMIKLLK